MNKLHCRICGGEHKNTADNFPLKFYGDVEVFQGRGRNRKSLGLKSQVIGYGCKKCFSKHRREEFIKEQKIKAKDGQRVNEAIQDKVKELRLSAKRRQQVQPQLQVKPKGREKVKNWIKDRFFKRQRKE